jgi:hypothetical protein
LPTKTLQKTRYQAVIASPAVRAGVISAGFFLLTTIAAAQTPTSTADEVARRAMDILAGPAWEKARYFSFTFNVEREGKLAASFPQKWDRSTGDYRVSGKTREGVPFELVMNVNTRKGHGTQNGAAVTDPAELEKLLTLGYQRFVNDTYWLLMPLKMFDPGVHRTYDGERRDSCGHTWDLVKLSLDPGVGLTPGDIYWAWVNRDSGIVDEWDMMLQTTKPDERPTEVMFRDYRRVSGLLLSTRREVRGKGQIVRLDDLQILPDVPKGTFQ